MEALTRTLTDRRYKEGTIAYCELHDQALVGDKSIVFWLMDAEMYVTNMSEVTLRTLVIDRGIRKLGRSTARSFESWEEKDQEFLNLPHAGSNNLYRHARLQYNLPDDPRLRYKFLNEFDRAMVQHLEKKYNWPDSPKGNVTWTHREDKIVPFDRGRLVFVFTFHPTKSSTDYRIGSPLKGVHGAVFSSNNAEFGGHDGIDCRVEHKPTNEICGGRDYYVQLYIPSMTCTVYAPDSC
ncbi:glycoside hydrolase family 13 protein [Gonapodya prolifera JEL478]|uniref:Glycoside hydrolase family 13 protein n=1 Tax=Gonapodya prolifera (strain JEL478) TaxID=1344416 RepID=A0A138ZYB3_GONPJ|nr:glycoside hydrolase family 13 protein [Gonapodya prolifera JEL478]|eukprot:KXS09461.1 glycoside hydrolase family 13 protein [Gonapodya prolifera JEL478]